MEERPRLRYIEAIPLSDQGRDIIVLRDPEGVSDQQIVISREAAYILSLMDGSRSLRDMQAEFMRASGHLVHIEKIEELVRVLDSNLFLQSERYDRQLTAMKTSYGALAVRPSYLAGKSYPARRIDLLLALDEMFRPPPKTIQTERVSVAGILAPHIDYDRGKRVYRNTYGPLRQAPKPLIIILGTSHRPMDRMISISLRDWETPLETVRISRELADLVAGHSLLKTYIDEWPHRTEHSIELQLPLLQFVNECDFEILPILTGSLQAHIDGFARTGEGEIEELVSALKELVLSSTGPCLIVSAADLAHIGAQFGDKEGVNSFILTESQEKDRALLRAVEQVDGEQFFAMIKEEQDCRRICGLTPIYLQLRLLEGCTAEITDYDQWSDGASSVSFAGAYFTRSAPP